MNGTVNGDMHARERLVLGGKARVNGNVYYGVIEMAPGRRHNREADSARRRSAGRAAEPPARSRVRGCGGQIRRVVCRP